MKRLTERKENGVINVRYATEHETAIHRLAAIEDILGDGYELDRLRELVEVDRLKSKEVWTQAKYLRTFPVDPDFIERATILYISLLKGGEILCHTQGRAFSIDEIGKTVFLTRTEAVAALKAREQDE